MKKTLFILFIFICTLSSYSNEMIVLEEMKVIDINGTLYATDSSTPFSGKVIYHKDRKYYKDGKPDGKWVCFYPNGNLKSIENWKYGRLMGKYVLYLENGQKVFETTYLDGKDNGQYFMYHQNGQLQVKGAFKKGIPFGIWYFYNSNGKLIGKTVY